MSEAFTLADAAHFDEVFNATTADVPRQLIKHLLGEYERRTKLREEAIAAGYVAYAEEDSRILDELTTWIAWVRKQQSLAA